jgi:hypothetical protein
MIHSAAFSWQSTVMIHARFGLTSAAIAVVVLQSNSTCPQVAIHIPLSSLSTFFPCSDHPTIKAAVLL